MDFFETVMGRTSVRQFSQVPVDDGTWDRLLRAAMAAPSAVDMRPWDFVLVRRRETLLALAEALPYAKMCAAAAGAVLACGTPERAFGGDPEFAVIDTALACENLLLAAKDSGLGAVFTAVYPHREREEAVRRILRIPVATIPLALIPVGVPAESPRPKEKFQQELVHREAW